jgi:hypothetical protein
LIAVIPTICWASWNASGSTGMSPNRIHLHPKHYCFQVIDHRHPEHNFWDPLETTRHITDHIADLKIIKVCEHLHPVVTFLDQRETSCVIESGEDSKERLEENIIQQQGYGSDFTSTRKSELSVTTAQGARSNQE